MTVILGRHNCTVTALRHAPSTQRAVCLAHFYAVRNHRHLHLPSLLTGCDTKHPVLLIEPPREKRKRDVKSHLGGFGYSKPNIQYIFIWTSEPLIKNSKCEHGTFKLLHMTWELDVSPEQCVGSMFKFTLGCCWRRASCLLRLSPVVHKIRVDDPVTPRTPCVPWGECLFFYYILFGLLAPPCSLVYWTCPSAPCLAVSSPKHIKFLYVPITWVYEERLHPPHPPTPTPADKIILIDWYWESCSVIKAWGLRASWIV